MIVALKSRLHSAAWTTVLLPCILLLLVSCRGSNDTGHRAKDATPNLAKRSPLGAVVPTAKISTEGEIPIDFSVGNAMKFLYGNFDSSKQASTANLPAGAEKSSFFAAAKGMEVHPFFLAGTLDSGVDKIFLGTYGGPLGEGFACHGCAPLIGIAAFQKIADAWVLESSTKTAVFLGQWGQPPVARILRIGSERVGVKLEMTFSGQGSFTTAVSILVPWRGEIREAFNAIVAEGNGGQCGEVGMLPCVESRRNIAFVKGANPDYDNLDVTLSGTVLSEKPPYTAIEVNGKEHRRFSDGEYLLADSNSN